MPRLPSALQGAFPIVKRVHRAVSKARGRVSRATQSDEHWRVPRGAYLTSAETASAVGTELRFADQGRHVVRTLPQGLPNHDWFFAEFADLTYRPRCVLEIPDGIVVGNEAAHVTPAGILDAETSPYFGIASWREHPVYLRHALPERQQQPGSLLTLAAPGTASNYYHVLFDLVEKFMTYQECYPGVAPDAIYAHRSPGYAEQYLELLGLGEVPTVIPSKHTAVQAQRLLVPTLSNSLNVVPPATTAWIREHLLTQVPAAPATRLYLTRGAKRNTRRVGNEDALLRILGPLGFTVLDPGTLSVREQIATFAAAEVIVAPHGAGLSNLVFAPAGVKVLEIFAPKYLNAGYWSIATEIPQARYRYVVGEPTRGGYASPGHKMMQVYQDIVVPLDAFQAQLQALLAS